MDLGEQTPAQVLLRLANGYQISQAIHVAAVLGIADLLRDGPRGIDELAAESGAHPRSLYRLMRALASVGVFREEEGQRFELTPLGDCLRTDAPLSCKGWAAHLGLPYYWNAWAHLLHSVKTGENAFQHLHGMDVWHYRAQHPEVGTVFDQAMTDLARERTESVLAAYDFGRFSCVVDVGGGNGARLAAILTKHRSVHGVLFDQPHVVARAEQQLQAAGVADRCLIVGGSFFDAVPKGGDAYVLEQILHDWRDDQVKVILECCRRVMPANTALLVIERGVPPPNEGAEAKFSDLNMLVSPGGQERTTDEYAQLFAATGFRLVGVTPTATTACVFEATPV